jgi:putative solute:sodium symporter small subunit
MSEKDDFYDVSIFKPKKGPMGDEVVIILVVLAGWAVATFGFQILLHLMAESPHGDSLLTRLTFFNLPFHFWFTGQFLPLWFIILCALFNIYIDRLTERHSRRRDRSYE